ncbi:2Fe-2S iron-sulfur cluster-binding protein [Prochlorococcus sp. MIT 1341]|uniref:2Fe-2S iron-sulfur cluster-binding protein n=1 Tax=Prochlorococcus sp. MIT 1341 TaxID=3096221 RepID=UPI002A758239|nr:2Fe-2S iron-sulfur cluster-binding protein [Prochlorococcus sp. MIT 1341]
MPTIRFVREERDVNCPVGANLREVALKEGIEIYGLKGSLGNCNGCGQCITCFVEVLEEMDDCALSPLTEVEKLKLKRRSKSWRLSCQTLVMESVIVLTKPQSSFKNSHAIIKEAKERDLPV